ncbi:MAG: TonB family protein [Candidatus Acidiferrales bacterium]
MTRRGAARACGAMALLAVFLFASLAIARRREPKEAQNPGASAGRVAADRTGAVDTRDGLRLRLTTDLGNVRILTALPSGQPQVRYIVHIETDARNPGARQLLENYSLKVKSVSDGVWIDGTLPAGNRKRAKPQFWVNYEVTVPPSFSVDVATQGGDIQTQDIGGTASLVTQGGNINTGRIGMSPRGAARNGLVARIETQGGHITVSDVAGDLHAYTAGGHINVHDIAGTAYLHSDGGHVRANRIDGRADLETGGGNITVREARGGAVVRTAGGQIDLGEAFGSVRAQTGGGGIRVVHVTGPIELETSDGSICLTRVAGSVRAATGSGTITAWLNPDASKYVSKRLELSGASELESGNGDIIVYLPRSLAATIQAVVESGGDHRILADPAVPLKFIAAGAGSPVRAEAYLNGGGEPLRIKTSSGTVRLLFLDSDTSLRDTLIREQNVRIQDRLEELPRMPAESGPQDAGAIWTQEDWFSQWMDRIEESISGGVRVDPDEMQKRLVWSVQPVYPETAKRAGVEGLVRLQIRVNGEGRVEVLRVLEGQPTLADAAIDAAQKWRYRATRVNGKPVNVISTVVFNFQLH